MLWFLQQTKGYRKPIENSTFQKSLHKYPKLQKQLGMRYINYNEILDYIDELENKGHIYVLRPPKPMKVSRTTTDYHLLKLLYEEGKMAGEKFLYDAGLIKVII